MKKYIVIDREGYDFMIWTHSEPMTLAKLRSYFWSCGGDMRTEKYKDFTMEYICDAWDIDIKEYSGPTLFDL